LATVPGSRYIVGPSVIHKICLALLWYIVGLSSRAWYHRDLGPAYIPEFLWQNFSSYISSNTVMGTKLNRFLQILCIKIAVFGRFEELGLLKPQIRVSGISPCGTIDFSTWKQCLSQHAYMWNHPSTFAWLCSGVSVEEFRRSSSVSPSALGLSVHKEEASFNVFSFCYGQNYIVHLFLR